MTTTTIDIPDTDEKTRTGVSAILRALDDVRTGKLVCLCTDCELRRLTEEAAK